MHTPEGGRETAETPTDLYPWDELRKLSWADMFDRIEDLSHTTAKFWEEHTEAAEPPQTTITAEAPEENQA